jgi:hypothetical protein
VKLRRGDIVIRSRDGSGATFADLTGPGSFKKTHSDIVLAAAPDKARLVGGNVDQRVSPTLAALSGGVPTDPNVFAVLRYQG